jgi:hypothetical protein
VSRGLSLLVGALATSSALVATYLALGGASYEPTPVRDPCLPREWRSPAGADEAAEQFTLSALDGAACELGVSRERLALALATERGREELAAEHGIGGAELEAAVRAGIVRAIDDAERATALPPVVAAPLRALVSRLPVEQAIALVFDARELFARGGGPFGRIADLPP